MIKRGDVDANYAYYALHRLRIKPSEWCAMPRREKAFVTACIDLKAEADKKERNRAKRAGKRR